MHFMYVYTFLILFDNYRFPLAAAIPSREAAGNVTNTGTQQTNNIGQIV